MSARIRSSGRSRSSKTAHGGWLAPIVRSVLALSARRLANLEASSERHSTRSPAAMQWREAGMSRRLLQVVSALIGLLTVTLGGIQVFFGSQSPMYSGMMLPSSVILDSNLRFFGGVALGLGVVLLLIVPRIERYTLVFAAVWLCTFFGGLGRAVSWIQLGRPPGPFVLFTIIELVGAPLFILWQRDVASRRAADPGVFGRSAGR